MPPSLLPSSRLYFSMLNQITPYCKAKSELEANNIHMVSGDTVGLYMYVWWWGGGVVKLHKNPAYYSEDEMDTFDNNLVPTLWI